VGNNAAINLVVAANDAAYVWTAGQRANLSDYTSPLIWRVITANSWTELPIHYQQWPAGYGSGNGTCVALKRNNNYYWFTSGCYMKYYPVCEIDIS